jgi:hypothetical protein
MSAWHEGLGLAFIALGAGTIWRDGRPLFLPSARGDSRDSRRARYARRKAWRDVRLPLFWILFGLGWLTSLNEHWFYLWIESAALISLLSWDLIVWLRKRKRRDGRSAPAPAA